jgi:hypothetical protein
MPAQRFKQKSFRLQLIGSKRKYCDPMTALDFALARENSGSTGADHDGVVGRVRHSISKSFLITHVFRRKNNQCHVSLPDLCLRKSRGKSLIDGFLSGGFGGVSYSGANHN